MLVIENCYVIDLPKINDPRGNLTFVEERRHIPFDIRRVYYLYDVPGGAKGGRGHAFLLLRSWQKWS
ncbi:MAG: FdtA/QdtA family cupin domain-containing protein [Phycisphaerae bacterium]|nr:FdtA/QdtA family cupin domain-containing protein [Phycisphaerae bacterium]